jgi:signal transduction histidine kinase
MAAEAFPWMSRQIGRGEVVAFTRPDDLPPEAATDAATFVAHGTRSHACIPLVEDGVTRRVLALSTVREERAWPEPLVQQLGLIVEILGQILARKQAEVEVEESEALQRAMLSSLPSRIAVLDREARLLAVNRAWLDQQAERDAGPMARARVGTSYLDACREAVMTGEAGAREVTSSVEAVLAGVSQTTAIEYMEKREGAERWFLLSVIPLRGSRGGAVIARTDVTEQVLARNQLRQFSGHLLAAQEDERRRIARELHDDFNQRLVLLAIEISQMNGGPADGPAPGVRRMAERVGEISADLHRLAYRLHPFKLEYLGLAAAARGLCAEIGDAHDIAVTFSERDIPAALPSEIAVCVYRVLQEALSNVVKHSGSARAEVELTGDGSTMRLSVRDFGLGMAPRVAPSRQGLGLTSIRERLRSVNGVLTVDSAGAAGTTLVVRIPLSPVAVTR